MGNLERRDDFPDDLASKKIKTKFRFSKQPSVAIDEPEKKPVPEDDITKADPELLHGDYFEWIRGQLKGKDKLTSTKLSLLDTLEKSNLPADRKNELADKLVFAESKEDLQPVVDAINSSSKKLAGEEFEAQ